MASRDGMTSRTGMRRRSSRDGVCGNNAVQFQSCDGSGYCTALGENGCTVVVSRQLRGSFGYQISEEGKQNEIRGMLIGGSPTMHDPILVMSDTVIFISLCELLL